MQRLSLVELPVDEAIDQRLAIIRELTGVELKHTCHHSIDPEDTSASNTENLIGVTQVPLGIAGPLTVNGKKCLIPLATTEKGLVAGINRGCKLLEKCGGVKSVITYRGMTRAPVFVCQSVKEALAFVEWVRNRYEEVKSRVEMASTFIRLVAIEPWVVGRWVFLRFECCTGDAMGMNMVTAGVRLACAFIQKETRAKLVSVSGNMCVDKKPSALNLMTGRGRSVIAECVLREDAVLEILKVTPEEIKAANDAKHLGSAQAGSLGFNAQFANIVVAVYIATGQDPAQVVNGSLGMTLMEKNGDGDAWHASVTMPCLEVGTIGGGTIRETQREALAIMGVEGGASVPGVNADKLAEVIAAATLAGELSLLAELCRL